MSLLHYVMLYNLDYNIIPSIAVSTPAFLVYFLNANSLVTKHGGNAFMVKSVSKCF